MIIKRTAVTLGASFVALLIMSAATFACFLATFDLSVFGGGMSDGEILLWSTAVPSAAGLGGGVIAWFSDGERWRVTASVVTSFFLAIVWVFLGPVNATSGEESLSVQSALFWGSALHTTIATIHKPLVAARRTIIVCALSASSAIAGSLLLDADFSGPSLLASFAVWLLLPAISTFIRA